MPRKKTERATSWRTTTERRSRRSGRYHVDQGLFSQEKDRASPRGTEMK